MSNSTSSKISPPRVDLLVVGVGGGGGSIIQEMAQKIDGRSIKGHMPDFLVVDSDYRSFQNLPRSVSKFQLGLPAEARRAQEGLAAGPRDTKRDLSTTAAKAKAGSFIRSWVSKPVSVGRASGTGMDPGLGQRMAQAAKDQLIKRCKQYNVVIFVACLGGGVGSGALPVFASEVAKRQNGSSPLTLGILCLPFAFEGSQKMKIARQALSKTCPYLSGYVVLSNDKIFEICEKTTPLSNALSLLNQTLVKYLSDLIQTLSKPGLINIDFADLRAILKGCGRQLYFGRGEAQGKGRIEKVIEEVFSSPLFEMPAKIKRILFNVSGGSDLTLHDVQKVSTKIADLNRKAKIIFGVSESRRYRGKIKVVLLGVGAKKARKTDKKENEASKKDKPERIKEINKNRDQKDKPERIKEINKNRDQKDKPERIKKTKDQKKDKNPEQNAPKPSPAQALPQEGLSGGARRAEAVRPPRFAGSELKETPQQNRADFRPPRRNGLDVQREKQRAQDERRAQDTEWEIPAFMKE